MGASETPAERGSKGGLWESMVSMGSAEVTHGTMLQNM